MWRFRAEVGVVRPEYRFNKASIFRVIFSGGEVLMRALMRRMLPVVSALFCQIKKLHIAEV